MTEEEAFERVQEGDREAFTVIVEGTRGRLVTFLAPYFRWDLSLAEEVAQRAYVRAFEKRAQYQVGRPFRPWFFRLARNLALDELRSRKPQVSVEEFGDILRSGDDPARAASQEEEVRKLVEAMESLPPVQKEVADMVRQGFSYREIAEVLDMSEVSARNNLAHAVKKLRQLLGVVETQGGRE